MAIKALWVNKLVNPYVGGHNKALKSFQTALTPQINSKSATWMLTGVWKLDHKSLFTHI